MLVELMNTVEQTKKALKNINYNWNIDEANITEKQKIKLYTDGRLKLKFIENIDENPNLIITYHNDSLWLYDRYSQAKHIFRADKDDENVIIDYDQYNLNDCDFKDLIELLNKVENLFNQEVERVKNKQIKEFSKTIQAYNKLM